MTESQAQATKYIGDLTIATKAAALKYAHLEEVTGYLDISADAQMPVLTTVGGYPATMPPITQKNTWVINILDKHMLIGCQHHSLHDWEHFDDRQIAEMDGCNAVRWWAENKAALLSMARAAGRSFEPVAAISAATGSALCPST